MKNGLCIPLLFVLTTACFLAHGQQEQYSGTPETANPFFLVKQPLSITLKYSIKALRQETNDSTYIVSMLVFKTPGSGKDSMEVNLRARGNYRRKHCYFVPVKLKIKAAETRATPMEGVEGLKLVLPCVSDAYRSDYILKEYLAYRLYEHISPYHYKTRLVQLDLLEEKGRGTKTHKLLGFFIEDNDHLEARLGARKMKKNVHPLYQDPLSSVQNNLFEYMVGNTDFSTRQQHNQTLFYVDEKYVSVPYDFDMSGLVNAPYAAVSNIQRIRGNITEVTERLYKGYRRDTVLLQQVRRQLLALKPELMGELELLRPLFGDPGQYREAHHFMEVFFEEMMDDSRFERQIIAGMREG